MSLVSPAKYRELEGAIASGEFPIIVYGPSGSGKTHAIEEILKRRCKKGLYVDISSVETRKPLCKNTILLAHLYRVSDLDNVVYRDNIIIESNIHYLNKLEGYKLIKFNKMTGRKMQSIGEANGGMHFNGNLFSLSWNIRQEDYTLELYRFLGRIFYRKTSIGSIESDGDNLYVCLGPGREEPRDAAAGETTVSGSSRVAGSMSESGVRGPGPKEDRTKRPFLVESSEDGVQMENSSMEEIDSMFLNIVSSGGALPEPARMDSAGGTERGQGHWVAFGKRKILGYLYENMVNFGELEDLRVFSECASLTDGNDANILTLIQCILERSRGTTKKNTFRSLDTNYHRFVG